MEGSLVLVFLVTIAQSFSTQAAEKDSQQCYRCIRSTCEQEIADAKVCSAAYEFLSGLNLNIVGSNDAQCPQQDVQLKNITSDAYEETCSDSQSFCGKRVIKVNIHKYKNNATATPSNSTTTPSNATATNTTTTTPFPVLKPMGPTEYTFDYTVYSCTMPQRECSRDMYGSKSGENVTLEGGSVTLQMTATLTNPNTDCAKCKTKLCNKDMSNVPVPGASTPSFGYVDNASKYATLCMIFIYWASVKILQ